MSKTTINLITLCVSILLFICALYIYVSNRNSDMILYSWLGIDTENSFFAFIRSNSFTLYPWVKYNLTDGLWMLSYLLFIESVWGDEKSIKRIFCVSLISFAFILEMMQFLGWYPGTGDVLDIVFYIIAILIFLIFTKLKLMYYEKDI